MKAPRGRGGVLSVPAHEHHVAAFHADEDSCRLTCHHVTIKGVRAGSLDRLALGVRATQWQSLVTEDPDIIFLLDEEHRSFHRVVDPEKRKRPARLRLALGSRPVSVAERHPLPVQGRAAGQAEHSAARGRSAVGACRAGR